MKAVISSTYDDSYLFFVPIATWCWNKLGVDVICFLPLLDTIEETKKIYLISKQKNNGFINLKYYGFSAPDHKKSTYAQCSRLFSSSLLDLSKEEILITSDVDMAVFKVPPMEEDTFNIFGYDLVPEKQYPMCYASAPVKLWDTFFTKGRSTQECLDDLLGGIECESFRGNYWGKDQEELYNGIAYHAPVSVWRRARPGTQFATHRADRDDLNWRSYLGPDLVDAHLWRPGYTEENFHKILELLRTQYPNDKFQWLIDYRNEYIKLL